ncbi:unnamed protein product [Nesidiocoris tenuis]|uniref:Uncharacterized protein n=1 Tax=Nesidiocoris tenuis TaxID=355587 RepID=A0A6H5GAM0_9HEMI|nr:unnamed protein product [Nesidiocoris tenuis]
MPEISNIPVISKNSNIRENSNVLATSGKNQISRRNPSILGHSSYVGNTDSRLIKLQLPKLSFRYLRNFVSPFASQSFQELAAQSQNRGGPPGNEVYMTASTLTLPPTYDMIVSQGVPIDSATVADPPPPSYMEAMRLVEQEKANRDRTAA